jgi:hypothetical protein
MSQSNIDYTVGPALTMSDLHVSEIAPALSLSDLDIDVSVADCDDSPMTMSDLDDSITGGNIDNLFTISELDVSIIEQEDEDDYQMTMSELNDLIMDGQYDNLFTISELDDSPMSMYHLDDLIVENDNQFTLSELEVPFIERDDSPMSMSDLDESIIGNDNPSTLSELDIAFIEEECEFNTTTPIKNIDSINCECAVCLEPINKNENVAITKCKHIFCFQCIGKTLVNVGNNCPLCRTELIEYNMDDDDDETLGGEDSESEYDDDELISIIDNLSITNSIEDETNTDRFTLSFKMGPLKKITNRFLNKGYTPYDLMTILLQQYDNDTSKNFDELKNHVGDSINILNEIQNEERELVNMSENDILRSI